MTIRSFLDWFLSRRSILGSAPDASFGLLILRVWVGLMMAFAHGWSKLTTFGERADNFADPFGLGSTVTLVLTVFAEFFCALALAVGLFTRGAAIPLIITMFTAAFVIHGDDPFGRKELALLYLASFVTLLIAGPGKYSFDRMFVHNNSSSK